MTSRPPLPPFTLETAIQKVRMAEDAWNTRDPQRVAEAYTSDSQWRNSAEFPTGRDQIVAEVLAEAEQAATEFGIEIIDIRFKRINYVEEVRESVYERMITERQRIAAKYLSEGEGQKLEIEGRKEREEKQIISEAYKKAQEIMGKADAEAIRTYAEAYAKDLESRWTLVETWKIEQVDEEPNYKWDDKLVALG